MLSVENIHVSYEGIRALRDVSIKVMPGEVVCVLGANGAGKSTLLKTLSGIIHPKKGKVFFEGKDITYLPSYEVTKSGLSLVPEGRMIFGPLSVSDNLILGSYTRNQKKERAQIKSDLDLVYTLFPVLEEKAKSKAQTLSGGQQQMVAIGRAIMSSPKILLMDEPSVGLAPILISEIYKNIQRLNEMGLPILIVEQKTFLALKISTRAYVMETGEIKVSGKSSDVEKNEEIRKSYLGGQ